MIKKLLLIMQEGENRIANRIVTNKTKVNLLEFKITNCALYFDQCTNLFNNPHTYQHKSMCY